MFDCAEMFGILALFLLRTIRCYIRNAARGYAKLCTAQKLTPRRCHEPETRADRRRREDPIHRPQGQEDHRPADRRWRHPDRARDHSARRRDRPHRGRGRHHRHRQARGSGQCGPSRTRPEQAVEGDPCDRRLAVCGHAPPSRRLRALHAARRPDHVPEGHRAGHPARRHPKRPQRARIWCRIGRDERQPAGCGSPAT